MILGILLCVFSVIELPDSIQYLVWCHKEGTGISYALRDVITDSLWLLGGVVMLMVSAGMRAAERKRKRVRAIVGDADYILIDEVAEALPASRGKTERILQRCVDFGLFGEKAYLDMRSDCLVIRGEAPISKKARAEAEAEARAAKAAADNMDEYERTLKELRELNDRIPGEQMSAKISRLEDLTAKIFKLAKEQPQKLSGMRKFMDYYLPTSLKLLTRYEKLGIVGDNGCGKSTLLKLLTGIERPDSGVIDIGETVRFGYYSQQGLEFDDSMRVIDVVTAIAEQVELGDGRRMSASQLLQHFLFTPETQYNYVARLSGGERRRLYLCTVLMQSPNFLVLDEPTNDLDIVTLGILEEYLQAFRGCVIVVSHDRYFVDKVADHLLVFCGGGEIRDFAGTYSEYVAWKREYEAARRAEAAQARPKPQAAKTQAAEAVPRKLSFNEKRELEALETEIPVLEAEKAALEASLSSGTLPVEELTAQSRRIAELIASIDEKTMRWLELSER